MRRHQESFPWIIVMGGAVVYWTIALGIGIPSLYRFLGEPGPARRVSTTETRCVQAVKVDGSPVVFGDCINVRFLLDAPDLARPDRVVRFHDGVTPAPVYAGPDPEVGDPWISTPTPTENRIRRRARPDPADSIGRTAF